MKRGESGSEESLDDILASIRKIIADEPGQAAAPPTPDSPLVPQGSLASPIPAAPREPALSSSTQADKPRSVFGTPASAASAAPATPSSNGAVGIQLPSARDALSGASAKPAPGEQSEGFGFFRAALSAQTQPASAAEGPALNGATTPAASTAPSRSIAASIDDELADLIDEPAPVAESKETSQGAPEPEVAPASSFSTREAAPSVEAAREKWSQLINPTLSVTPDGSRAAAPTTSAPVSAAPTPSTPPKGIFAPRSGGFYPPQAKIEPSLSKPVAAPAPSDAATPVTPALSSSSQDNVTAGDPAAPSAAKAEAPASEPSLPELPISMRIDTLAASNPTAAAAAALDALALGLAKTGERPPEPAPRPPSSAAPTDTLIGSTLAARPASGPVPAPQAAPSAEPVAPAGPAAGPAPSVAPAAPISSQPRTLEDVVADMVRPMLEKWIDENMPRIVERALKLDATSGPKS